MIILYAGAYLSILSLLTMPCKENRFFYSRHSNNNDRWLQATLIEKKNSSTVLKKRKGQPMYEI